MKKKLFALVALLASVTMGANAQVYVGGSLGFTSSKISGGADQDGSSYKILPEIGYQLDDCVSIGLQIGYSHGYAAFGSLTVTDVKAMMNTMLSAYTDINEDGLKLNSFTFAPYIRYNVLELGDRAKLFVEGSVGYTNVKTDNVPAAAGTGGGDGKLDVLEIAVRPGIEIAFSNRLSATAKLGSLGYMSAKEKESDEKLTRFGLDCDSYNILLGFNFHF
ncbi:MAG: porin family protein [Prevotella sp.]|nr:porin family protein [Prevotella sp.]